MLSGRALDFAPAMVLFAAFGLFHGSAFGNVFAEQEATFGSQVLIGYLIGLAIIQYAISLTFGWLMMSVFQAKNAEAVEARLAGAVVGGAGLFLTMENIETHLLNLII